MNNFNNKTPNNIDIMFKEEIVTVMDTLVEKAIVRGNLVAYPDGRRIKSYISSGEELPDYLKPGYLIFELSEKERLELNNLKSEDILDVLL